MHDYQMQIPIYGHLKHLFLKRPTPQYARLFGPIRRGYDEVQVLDYGRNTAWVSTIAKALSPLRQGLGDAKKSTFLGVQPRARAARLGDVY